MAISSTTRIRTAVVGFGISGKVFHAPLIAADPRYSLDVIVTEDLARAAEAARLYPNAKIVPSTEAMLELSVNLDLAVLGTPPLTHFDLGAQAISHGLNVVVDKPFVTGVAEGQALMAQADDAGVQLTVFQNRRWDADFLTLRRLLADGALGDVRTFESRFEWWRPEGFGNWRDSTSAAQGGGILNDLGAHLIDQAILLFGPVAESYAETTNFGQAAAGAETEAFVSVLHSSGVRSRLWMNGMAAQPGPRFHVLGSKAAYTKWGLDSQELALASGISPSDPTYGSEPEKSWGQLGISGSTVKVPAERGSYPQFYAELADAIRGGTSLPVDPAESLEVLRVIEQIHSDS